MTEAGISLPGQDTWARFVLEQGITVFLLLLGGVLFTVFWGLISTRRNHLFRQIESIGGWLDELNASALSYFFEIRNARMILGNGIDLTQEQRYEILRRINAAGVRAYRALWSISPLLSSTVVFDHPVLSERLKKYADDTSRVQKMLADLRSPFEGDPVPVIERAGKLLQATQNGVEEIYELMAAESTPTACIRFYWDRVNRYLRESEPFERLKDGR